MPHSTGIDTPSTSTSSSQSKAAAAAEQAIGPSRYPPNADSTVSSRTLSNADYSSRTVEMALYQSERDPTKALISISPSNVPSICFSAYSADRQFPLLEAVKLAVNSNEWAHFDALVDIVSGASPIGSFDSPPLHLLTGAENREEEEIEKEMEKEREKEMEKEGDKRVISKDEAAFGRVRSAGMRMCAQALLVSQFDMRLMRCRMFLFWI
jgi:hypothetical protein